MHIEENRIYTTKEVAELLRISMPTVKRMLKDGRLPSSRIGRQHRFLGKDLLALMTTRADLSKLSAPAPVARPAAPPVAPIAHPQSPRQAAAPVQPAQYAPPPTAPAPQQPARFIEYSDESPTQLNAIESRQRLYMLGKTAKRDVFLDSGEPLIRLGEEVTDDIILAAKKSKRMMDLFSSLREPGE